MEVLLAGGVILAAVIGGFLLLLAKVSELKNDSGVGLLKQDLTNMNQRLDRAAEVFGGLQQELGKMQELGRGLKDIQDVLKSPKLRGNVGERLMADLIKQNIPKDNYKLQYEFKSKAKVDAIVKTKNGLIPIDSKFPVENYLKYAQAKDEADKTAFHKQFTADVKRHINDIAKKYILPGEGTVDFALMYVPGEAVYYEIMTNTDLDIYANSVRVFLVSPHTFTYYLGIILLSLEGDMIEERAKEVMNFLKDIQGDTRRFAEEFNLVQKHLGNAKAQMDNASNSFSRLGSKIDSASKLTAPDTKPRKLEQPVAALLQEEE